MKSKMHTENSKHSYYTLPDMVKLQEKNPAEYKKAESKEYEFIGLPGHMPKQIRNIANEHFDPTDMIIAKMQWSKDHWTLQCMELKHSLQSEIKVEPLKPTLIPFKFDLQTDYGFKYMEIDGEPNFPYRKKSIEVAIERANKIECHESDLIEFESNGYKEQFTKAKLLEMFETLLVDTEVILMDLNKKRIVKIKQGNKNVEITIGELENTLTTIKNKSYVK